MNHLVAPVNLINTASTVIVLYVDLFVFARSYCLFLSFIRPELVVKKLRYYARYIVVCLLLNKMDLVKVLVKVWKPYC